VLDLDIVTVPFVDVEDWTGSSCILVVLDALVMVGLEFFSTWIVVAFLDEDEEVLDVFVVVVAVVDDDLAEVDCLDVCFFCETIFRASCMA
jgi:hypothetical protein